MRIVRRQRQCPTRNCEQLQSLTLPGQIVQFGRPQLVGVQSRSCVPSPCQQHLIGEDAVVLHVVVDARELVRGGALRATTAFCE